MYALARLNKLEEDEDEQGVEEESFGIKVRDADSFAQLCVASLALLRSPVTKNLTLWRLT